MELNKAAHIPTNETASELLNLLTDPPKYAERLKLLDDRLKMINEAAARFDSYADIERFKSDAEFQAAEATRKAETAKAELEESRKAAAKAHEDAKRYNITVRANEERRKKELDVRQEALDAKEHELLRREQEAKAAMESADKNEQYCKEMLAEAHAIKAEYEGRLEKIRAAAA